MFMSDQKVEPIMIEGMPQNNHPDLLTGSITKSVVRLSLPLERLLIIICGSVALIRHSQLTFASPSCLATILERCPVWSPLSETWQVT